MSDLKLLLTPSQRQLLRDAAHRLGVREQVIARNAVLAALSDSTLVNPPPPPQPDILDALNAIARKLGAAKAELDALIERSNGGGHDDQVALLAASDATTARARALVAEVGRGPGVPGGIEGNGEETTGSDGAGAGAGVPGRPRVKRAK